MKKITLRFLCKNDLKGTFDLLQNPKVMQYIGPRRPLTDDEVTEWFDTEINNPSRFVIASIKSDEIIGFCGIKEIDGVLDFGYFLREVFWNQGYATEACRIALLQLASTINIFEIEIFIALDNHASRSVATKLNWLQLSSVKKNGELGHFYAVKNLL
jgi:ribosomal-protein-alanine N-acetyltransferase